MANIHEYHGTIKVGSEVIGGASDGLSPIFHHVPCPPGQGTLNVDITNVRYATVMQYNVRPQPFPRTVHLLHEPVFVSPRSGPVMEPVGHPGTLYGPQGGNPTWGNLSVSRPWALICLMEAHSDV